MTSGRTERGKSAGAMPKKAMKAKDGRSPSPVVGGGASASSYANRGACHRWLSPNPDKAWAERFFLCYSAVWPLLFGAWTQSGTHLQFGDVGNLAVTVAIASPNVLVPWACAPPLPGVHWSERYWFKFNVWISVFAFVASYFWTEYFFDVLRMTYNFPHLKWNLDSVLLGSGRQRVPLMMYIHAHYFFVTYHTLSVIVIRVVRQEALSRCGAGMWPLAELASFVGTAMFFAWLEIYATTMDAIKEQFSYADMDWALSWGAALYSCYFICSFPMVFWLDEEAIWTVSPPRWGMGRVVQSALAAGMMGFILLDLVAQFVIVDWPH
jgi:cycloeucalenol cycloisomerase